MCRKADAKERDDLGLCKTKLKKMEYRKEFNIKRKIADRQYWERTGYIPVGVKYDEALGEYNWTGPQRTVIDNLREKIKVTEDPEKRQHYLDLIEEITKEIEERQKEKDRVAKKAKELEEKIKAERARFKNIEKKEEKDYYTYGYADDSYEELCRLREERMKNLWRPESEFKEQLDGEDSKDNENKEDKENGDNDTIHNTDNDSNTNDSI